jgi:hypothetical protein
MLLTRAYSLLFVPCFAPRLQARPRRAGRPRRPDRHPEAAENAQEIVRDPARVTLV